MNRQSRSLFIIVCLNFFALTACSSRFEPAPVETLSTRIATSNNLTEISGETYTVQGGDTLFSIAFYSGNAYRDLAKINNISAPYSIKVGQVIRLTPLQKKRAPSTNIDIAQTKPNKTKVLVDPPSPRAYRETKQKTQTKNTKTPVKTAASTSKSVATNRWIWPAKGERTIATVGTDGSNRGLDIKGSIGSKILASASGKVVYAGNALKGYGNLIIIKHDDEYLSAYAHNEKILVGEQTYVEQGQQIATMGQSGASEVMLHFEIRKKGKSRDPFIYLPKR
jgi:lipoprotein NlpD